MAGNGLEFLADNYPEAIETLSTLIEQDRIELVSSTYAPTLWVAFPRRDLERSIKLNRVALERLGLRASPIFFAQEGLFGAGLEVVSDWFNLAVCKEDTLRVFANGAGGRPVYRLGKLCVVIGANHILHEMASGVIRSMQQGRAPDCNLFYEAHMQEAVNSYSHSAAEYVEGSAGDLTWRWYHLGSAHHFTTTAPPQNWETFFCDPEWMTMTCGLMENLLAERFHFSFIEEFARCFKPSMLESLPTAIESSWNPNRSLGVYTWMGKQEQRWQSGGGLLTLAWRARRSLRQSELAVDALPDGAHKQQLQRQLNDIWREQIVGESSDPFGWSPLPCEVNFGREQGDRVLQMCAALSARLPAGAGTDSTTLASWRGFGVRLNNPLATSELLGAEGSVEWRQISDGLHVCEARFRADAHTCGLRFKRSSSSVAYSPSGCEDRAISIALNDFPQSSIYLPLANGFISIGDELHLIRDNCTVAIAAHVVKDEPWVTFAVDGTSEGRLFEWRFFLVRGTQQDALQAANLINLI
jgi:hypothetical protein